MFKKAYGKSAGTWKNTPRADKKPFDNSLHTATCSGCGKDCQVPFKPNGKKPVFCSACYIREEKSGSQSDKSSFYEKKSAYQSRPHARPEGRPASSGMTSEQFKTLNAKLDLLIGLIQGDE